MQIAPFLFRSLFLFILSITFHYGYGQSPHDLKNDFKLGYYMIQAKHSGKYLNVKDASMGDNADIRQYAKNTAYNEQFALIPTVKEIGRQYFMIMARHSGKFANVQEASMNDGAKVRQYRKVINPQTKQIADNELFYFEETSPKVYRIRCKHSGKYWNIQNASVNDNANVIQFSKSEAAEEFVFYLTESIEIPPKPKDEVFEYGKVQHYRHDGVLDPIKTRTTVEYIPFYMVNDPQVENGFLENPWYKLVRTDFWNPVRTNFCQADSDSDCPETFTISKSWSKEVSSSFSNTTGLSIGIEAGAEVEGIGFKETYTLSTSFTVTKGITYTTSETETLEVPLDTKKGSSKTLWQESAQFTLLRGSGEVVNKWFAPLPETTTSILYCSDVPCD